MQKDDTATRIRERVKLRMVHGYDAVMRGDLSEAERAFSYAARHLPDSPVPEVLVATLHIARRDVPGALRTLRRLCRRYPANALARAHLVEAYVLSGNSEHARHHLTVLDSLDASLEVREFAKALAEWVSSPTE